MLALRRQCAGGGADGFRSLPIRVGVVVGHVEKPGHGLDRMPFRARLPPNLLSDSTLHGARPNNEPRLSLSPEGRARCHASIAVAARWRGLIRFTPSVKRSGDEADEWSRRSVIRMTPRHELPAARRHKYLNFRRFLQRCIITVGTNQDTMGLAWSVSIEKTRRKSGVARIECHAASPSKEAGYSGVLSGASLYGLRRPSCKSAPSFFILERRLAIRCLALGSMAWSSVLIRSAVIPLGNPLTISMI